MKSQPGADSSIPASRWKQRIVIRGKTTGTEQEIPRDAWPMYPKEDWERIDPDPGLTGYETTPADEEGGKS